MRVRETLDVLDCRGEAHRHVYAGDGHEPLDGLIAEGSLSDVAFDEAQLFGQPVQRLDMALHR